MAHRLPGSVQSLLRVLLSHYFLNGLMVSLGLGLIVLLLLETAGLAAASTAAVGVLSTSLPDVPSPRKRKIMQMLPAPLLAAPLFVLVQLVQGNAWLLGLVLCAGTALAVMVMAWGKRGGPICYAILIAMLLSMAAPPVQGLTDLLLHGAWFLVGAGAYLVWGVLAANVLNPRYRQQLLAECLHTFAGILYTQARRFTAPPEQQAKLLLELLNQQATFVEQLQATRDMVLESPTRPVRIRQAAALMALLEARDQQLACDLELDNLLALHQAEPADQATPEALAAMAQTLDNAADQLHRLALALLLKSRGRAGLAGAKSSLPEPFFNHLALTPSLPALLRQTAGRVALIEAEAGRIACLLQGSIAPELAAVQAQWQLFVSPTRWSFKPLLGQIAWRAPTLRYALRMALAVGVGYAVAMHLPWVAHEYWILLTIVVVLRANLAQTVQRRNDRIAGTLLGCVLVLGLLSLHPGTRTIFLIIALGIGISHAFVLRRYLVAATAATVGALLQVHLLQTPHPMALDGSLLASLPALPESFGLAPFAIYERLADTLLGAALAWLFSYVLPVWERGAIPALVQRSLAAQLAHAHLALAWRAQALDLDDSDMPWRLARREAYNSISELTLATQRTLAEPNTVQLALEPLQALQTRSYRLLAQLTAIKSVLLLHRARLNAPVAQQALQEALAQIQQALQPTAGTSTLYTKLDSTEAMLPTASANAESVIDLTPWLLRRLRNASAMAMQLQLSAAQTTK